MGVESERCLRHDFPHPGGCYGNNPTSARNTPLEGDSVRRGGADGGRTAGVVTVLCFRHTHSGSSSSSVGRLDVDSGGGTHRGKSPFHAGPSNATFGTVTSEKKILFRNVFTQNVPELIHNNPQFVQ